MKITAVEEYGLRCLLRVAPREEDDPVSAQAIAELEGMSVPYTQKILRILSKSGLVESKRGAHGGYYLGAAAEEISVGDVMRALGGFVEIDDICERHTGELDVCKNACGCTIRPVWSHISEFVMETMDRIPLSVLTEDEFTVRRHLAGLSLDGSAAASLSPS
jgi:Rrf2 family transcriptional regulator, iron-sulfur cluster assembly transcription factor